MKWNLMLVALGAAVLAAPAFAHQSRQEEHARRDGPVSHQEMQARADRWFGRLDANGDGHVTAPEIQGRRDGRGGGDHERGRGHHGRHGDSFRALRDGGEVNLAHLPSRLRERFDRMDLNRDGRLTSAEAMQARAARAQQRFVGADADRDGALSREELRAGAAARFARLDANRDGVATRDEIKAAKEARRSWR